ncbi:MAG: site-2 protease family protein [Desulfurococcales archaeon]|nr:site-2 protease family protein [Desulfurococcales archaeon]
MATAINPPEEPVAECISEVKRYFEISEEASRVSHNAAEIKIVEPKGRMPWSTNLNLAYRSLVKKGCYPRLTIRRNGIFLLLLKKGEDKSKLTLGAVLAVTTLVLVYISGDALTSEVAPSKSLAWTPLGYLVALLVPLIIHELGHWFTLKKFSTPASIPYLLPAPPLQLGFLGTFGAIINLRWLPPNTRGLVLSAVMGPLAGFLAAIPFALWGVKTSIVLPASAVSGVIPLVPLVYMLIPPPAPVGPHEVLVLSPVGFAAYVVFFVTFLNLIPVATLDGGHVIRGILGYRGHKVVSYLTVGILLLASARWPMLTLFSLLALFFLYSQRRGHPGTAMGVTSSRDPVVALAGVVYVVLLVLTLPVPITG